MFIDTYEDEEANRIDKLIRESEAILHDADIERLKSLISTMKGPKWDDKVVQFAKEAGKSRSTIYHWLWKGAPSDALDAIEFRLTVPSRSTTE